MSRDGNFGADLNPMIDRNERSAMPFGAFAFCPPGIIAASQWAEIYRIARERTLEALRPTHYDRALRASAN